MTAVRVNPTEGQMHVGDYYEAAWTATSSSAMNTQLTGSITLPAGTYIVSASFPVLSSVPFYAYLRGVVKYFGMAGYHVHSASWVVKLTETRTISLISGQSDPCTFTYRERGGLYAVRLA